MNLSVDPLDQNARCVETASIHSHIKMNYHHGCQINLKTNQKAIEAKKAEEVDDAKKVEEAKKGKNKRQVNDI